MAEKDKLAKLYDFLKHDVEVSFLDGDVIDVAMDVISKHIERIKKLEKLLSTHEPHGRNYTNEQYVQLRERVQESEEQKLALIEEMGQVDEHFLDLEQQNKKLREALEFYATRDNYKLEHFDPNLNDYMSTVDYDEGEIARKALEKSK